MLKHFLLVAALGLFMGLSVAGNAEAAPFAAGFDKQVDQATGGRAVIKINGWWAVPVVVGGVVLLHHIHRHHRRHYYVHHHHHHYYHRRHRRYR